MQKYDVAVIGLGAMGSATSYQLANSGAKVLGIDQFTPPHKLGSSHGESRITRQAIAEGREYVPLVLRANEIWHEIEQEISSQLYVQTGILILASNASQKPNKFVDNTIAAAKEYGIKHQELSGADIASRFPQFNVQGNEKGYFEDGAGYLKPEDCVQAQLSLAEKYGAHLQYDEKLISYKQRKDYVHILTDKGEYQADRLVLTVGPWVQAFMPETYKNHMQIYRQVLYWFEIAGDSSKFEAKNFPVFNWEFNTAHEDFMYGFPTLDGRSIKVATEQYAVTTRPDLVDRTVSEEEIRMMYDEYVRPHIPGLSSECLKAEACLYSKAPDWKFLIDYHPDNQNVIIASPCSGHGFKHSAAIGEVIADMAAGSKPRIDISSMGFAGIGA